MLPVLLVRLMLNPNVLLVGNTFHVDVLYVFFLFPAFRYIFAQISQVFCWLYHPNESRRYRYKHTHTHIYIYTRIYNYIYTYIYIYIYVYIYIYIYYIYTINIYIYRYIMDYNNGIIIYIYIYVLFIYRQYILHIHIRSTPFFLCLR